MNNEKQQPADYMKYAQYLTKLALPTAEDLLPALSKFHSILYDAFGYSATRSREALKDTHNKQATKWFRPQSIRFYVHCFLSLKGLPSQLVDENGNIEDDKTIFKPQVLANNGIAGTIMGYPYRIYKMFNGGLPIPVSENQKKYYNQAPLEGIKLPFPGFLEDQPDIIIPKPNLLYVWQIVKNITPILYYAVPHNALLYATTPLTLIPNPITTMRPLEEEKEKEHIDINTRKQRE